MKNSRFAAVLLIALALIHPAMGSRDAQYDEEARELERQEKALRKQEHKKKNPVRNFAGGVKQATVDNTTGIIDETQEGAQDGPVTGTLEGTRRASGRVLDNTVRGAVKVATLGYGEVDTYEVVEPEKGTDEPTKIKFGF
jgi:hypothetical protein